MAREENGHTEEMSLIHFFFFFFFTYCFLVLIGKLEHCQLALREEGLGFGDGGEGEEGRKEGQVKLHFRMQIV